MSDFVDSTLEALMGVQHLLLYMLMWANLCLLVVFIVILYVKYVRGDWEYIKHQKSFENGRPLADMVLDTIHDARDFANSQRFELVWVDIRPRRGSVTTIYILYKVVR